MTIDLMLLDPSQHCFIVCFIIAVGSRIYIQAHFVVTIARLDFNNLNSRFKLSYLAIMLIWSGNFGMMLKEESPVNRYSANNTELSNLHFINLANSFNFVFFFNSSIHLWLTPFSPID